MFKISYCIDFIGTDEAARGRGIGADLLAAGVDWMLSAPAMKKISLTVHADNLPARRLYESCQWEIQGDLAELGSTSYRKQLIC